MIKERVLSSIFVWRLSGVSYRTSVIATHGFYVPKEKYLEETKNQMLPLLKYFNNIDRVLEFGCGIGGNLIGISDNIKEGLGIDINPLFIFQANKLKKMAGKKNIDFISYDGKKFPMMGKFNSIYSIGVFERIPKNIVVSYIRSLKNYLYENGRMMIYFLSERAKGTIFTKRLGENAYVYWTRKEVEQLIKELNLEIEDYFPWYSNFQAFEADKSVADMCIVRKKNV
ncbi:MAG: methyltransferase domain-containing protein [Thermoprotei archaeon]